MPVSITDLLYGILAPAALAGALFVLLGRGLPSDIAKRFAATAGLAAGFCLGYGLLELGPWIPETHWHWLPAAVVATLAAGPVARAGGVSWLERSLLYVLLAAVTGWFLIPTWNDLEPSRTTLLAGWCGYVVLVSLLLEALCSRATGGGLPLVLILTLLAAAVVLALSGSLRFAQIAGAGMGAMLGIGVTLVWSGTKDGLRGGMLAFTVFAAGALLIGRLNSFSDVPWASYLLVPVAPLALWLSVTGPLGKVTGWKRWLLQIGLAMLPLAAAVLLAAVAELGD